LGDKFQYVKLPNGEYGKFSADATDDVIRSTIAKDFPEAFAAPNAGLATPKDNSKVAIKEMNPVNRALLTGWLEAGDTAKGLVTGFPPVAGAMDTVQNINDIRKMGFGGWWKVRQAQQAEQDAKPVTEKLGEAAGVNVDDLKSNIDSGNYAGAGMNVAAAVGRVILPARLMRTPVTTKAQVSGAASTITQGARTAIPPAVEAALPALKVEAAEQGIKPKHMTVDKFSRVTDGLDAKLEQSFQQVKARANPNQANIPGMTLAQEAINRVDTAFPWLRTARPQVRQAIAQKFRDKYGNRNWSIEELDAERRAANHESTSTLNAKQVTKEQAMQDPELAADVFAGDALRDVLYDEIGRRTGEDMQGLKRQQSNLATIRRQLTVQKTELPNKQANAEGAPYIEGVVDAHGPWDATKKAATGKYLEPEAKVNRRLRKAFARKTQTPPLAYGIGPSIQERR
jgi:hypothetical protein